MIGESGLLGKMAPVTGVDFRESASRATAALIDRWPDSGLPGLEGVDSSLCFPAEPNPRAALKRFSALYEGTWQLAPEAGALRVLVFGESAAQVFAPIVFTIGAPGQAPQTTRFLMNQLLVKTSGGWKIANLLPIPAPAP